MSQPRELVLLYPFLLTQLPLRMAALGRSHDALLLDGSYLYLQGTR